MRLEGEMTLNHETLHELVCREINRRGVSIAGAKWSVKDGEVTFTFTAILKDADQDTLPPKLGELVSLASTCSVCGADRSHQRPIGLCTACDARRMALDDDVARATERSKPR